MSIYTLRTPAPNITNAGVVGYAVETAGARWLWRDSAGKDHFLGTFGGGANTPFYGQYVNTFTGASDFLDGSAVEAIGYGNFGAMLDDKFYFATTDSSVGSFCGYDPATGTLSLIHKDTPLGHSSLNITVGEDGIVYWATIPRWDDATQGIHLYGYEPGGAGFFDIGVPVATSSYTHTIQADATHLYFAVKLADDTYQLLCSSDGGSSWAAPTDWTFNSSGDTLHQLIRKRLTGEIVCNRTLADASRKAYYLSGGVATDSGGSVHIQDEFDPKLRPEKCTKMTSASDYANGAAYYDLTLEMSLFFPGKDFWEKTKFGYQPDGAPSMTYTEFDYTGEWVAKEIMCIVPLGSSLLAIESGYNTSLLLDYVTPANNDYLGFHVSSPYHAVKVSTGEVYIGLYPGYFLRYDPTSAWTLTPADNALYVPADEGKPNPYFCDLTVGAPTDTVHRWTHIEEDNDGNIWIGGQSQASYGSICVYHPSDGATDYPYAAWEGTSTSFSSLCLAVNKTKAVIADRAGYLHVMDVATQTEDGTYYLGDPTVPGYIAYIVNTPSGVLGVTENSKVFLFNATTRTMIIEPQAFGDGITGTIFGWGVNSTYRQYNHLILGPDNYVWFFVGSNLYRINPANLVFELVKDFGTDYGKITFANNNVDVLIHENSTDLLYLAGVLIRSGRLLNGIEGLGKFNGSSNISKINGVTL